jgi:hypothetical protein
MLTLVWIVRSPLSRKAVALALRALTRQLGSLELLRSSGNTEVVVKVELSAN